MKNRWIIGGSCTGKTEKLVQALQVWLEQKKQIKKSNFSTDKSSLLILAANNTNRQALVERLAAASGGAYPVVCKTPLGFIMDEVKLFWPILFDLLELKAQFPLLLRPETEQDLATHLWREEADWEVLIQSEGEYKFVRQTLDLLQLAGAAGIAPKDIAYMLETGMPERDSQLELVLTSSIAQRRGEILLKWRKWCLERGLLTYGIILELYWRYLLLHPSYQNHLINRYAGILADDLDNYPAIMKDLFDYLLDQGIWGIFTFNSQGKVRLGLNADPEYLAQLSSRCTRETLSQSSGSSLAVILQTKILRLINEPNFFTDLPASICSIQTISRATLLRQTAETIIQAVKSAKIKPEEIAIIAPGLDEIARYTLIETISSQNIPINPVNEQRPLISSALIRSLLTLLALLYPGLGRLIEKDGVAEMLVMLSCRREEGKLVPQIDPVRAGLITDRCYCVDPEYPKLLPAQAIDRWDRLGYKATRAYEVIFNWLTKAKALQSQKNPPSVLTLLDLAIKELVQPQNLSPINLISLRELSETAYHYWELDRRLRQYTPNLASSTQTISRFIQLLRRGTITANPRPLGYLDKQTPGITLATIFQYRALNTSHRWQFWLDASSHLWSQGSAANLFASSVFLRGWSGKMLTAEDKLLSDRLRLETIVTDLLARTKERIYLCHSDLGVNGTEQTGDLTSLVYAARQLAIA